MEPEVMKAIPRSSAIKRVVIYVGIGLLLGWAGQSFLRPVVTRYLSVDSREEVFSRLQVLAVGLSVFELSIAIYVGVVAITGEGAIE
jgi:ACR3 family arsenite efflux pump ArsB